MTRDERANAAIERRNDWVFDAHKNDSFHQSKLTIFISDL